MKAKWFWLISLLILSAMMAACSGTTSTSSTTATPVANGATAQTSNRQGNTTSQATRPANAASSVANTTASAPQAAPTAIPLPQIVIPTPVPATTATRSSATTLPTTSAPAAPSTTTQTPTVTEPSEISLADVRGKIIFFSDRGGGYAQLYMMNADGSHQQLCNCSEVLEALVANERNSPDQKQFLFVKSVGGSGRGGADVQIWAHNVETGYETVVAGAAPGFPGVDYDPVWSPNAKHIAWVTQANGFDEIYLYDATTNENLRLTESKGEWYKHPSFSPDGAQLVYWTNRAQAERKQIWVMALDGSGAHNLSQNEFNDWDPIWVK